MTDVTSKDEADTDVPNILDDLPDGSEYISVTDRYFTRRYCLNVKEIENNDYQLLFHSNRICLLTLAPSHFFFKHDGAFKVNYDIGSGDRRKNVVKGKGKKGGQILESNTGICKIELDDGTEFTVPSCMKGKLIEVNENLVENTDLLRNCPDSDGYLAVMLSTIDLSDARKNELLSHEEYLEIMKDK